MDRFTRSFLEVRAELLRFLRRRAGRATAEDVVQDVWVRLRERSDPKSWREPRAVFFTTAANLAIDAHRREAVAEKVLAPESASEAASEAADPEAQAEAARSVERLVAALEQLPPACREAFLLNRLENLTHKEIANRFGVSTKTIQRHIQRALRACVRVME
jgi:RNA polymerase sigma-70 factor (ECF subfamily)